MSAGSITQIFDVLKGAKTSWPKRPEIFIPRGDAEFYNGTLYEVIISDFAITGGITGINGLSNGLPTLSANFLIIF